MENSQSVIANHIKIDAETKEEIHDTLVNDSQPNRFELLVLRSKHNKTRERTAHPIVQTFIEHGPLTPIYNKYWATISETVVFPPPPPTTSSTYNNNSYDLLQSTSEATSKTIHNTRFWAMVGFEQVPPIH